MLGNCFELNGGAPGVLLIHGFTGTPWELRPVADALAAGGFACRAPVLPGHGTTASALSRTRWDDWVAAVAQELDAWLARHHRVVVVGMSVGALLGLDAVVRRQHRGVIGVVTLGCALRLSQTAERAIAAATLLGDWMPHVLIPKRGGASDMQDVVVRAHNPGYTTQPLRAAREIAVGQRLVRAALPELRLPLLALHGLRDRTAPLEASLELLRTAGSADSALVVLPRSGHLIGVDRDRDEVARQVSAFVSRLASEAPRDPVTAQNARV